MVPDSARLMTMVSNYASALYACDDLVLVRDWHELLPYVFIINTQFEDEIVPSNDPIWLTLHHNLAGLVAM